MVLTALHFICSSRQIRKEYPIWVYCIFPLCYLQPDLSTVLNPKVSIKEQIDHPGKSLQFWLEEQKTELLKLRDWGNHPFFFLLFLHSLSFQASGNLVVGEVGGGSNEIMWKMAGANILREENLHFSFGGGTGPRRRAKYFFLPLFFFFLKIFSCPLVI